MNVTFDTAELATTAEEQSPALYQILGPPSVTGIATLAAAALAAWMISKQIKSNQLLAEKERETSYHRLVTAICLELYQIQSALTIWISLVHNLFERCARERKEPISTEIYSEAIFPEPAFLTKLEMEIGGLEGEAAEFTLRSIMAFNVVQTGFGIMLKRPVLVERHSVETTRDHVAQFLAIANLARYHLFRSIGADVSEFNKATLDQDYADAVQKADKAMMDALDIKPPA